MSVALKIKRKDSKKSIFQSLKNEPNFTLKGMTFDAPHLEKFIARPMTASTRVTSNRYSNRAENIHPTTKRDKAIDTVYSNNEIMNISKLRNSAEGN